MSVVQETEVSSADHVSSAMQVLTSRNVWDSDCEIAI